MNQLASGHDVASSPWPSPWPSPWRRILTAATAMIAVIAASASDAGAQTRNIVQRGDAVVTGFAGTVAPAAPPADVHPLDRTFIDLKGLTTQIFDLSNLGGGPAGQLADAPVKFRATAGQVGHVFGIAFEGDGVSGPPNIFLAASSMYGLQIVKPDGNDVRRLVSGEPGARFMAGQFGPGRGGPGSIYHINGRTGEIKLFANVAREGRANSGPGLGNLAYAPRSKQLFAADLETGMIHRFGMDGRERDVFDHGVDGRKRAGLEAIAYDPSGRVGIENPAFNAEDTTTWGLAPKERMTFGLAVQSGRLYYSVAEGPQVWSVGIDEEGDFGKDARLEIDVKDTPAGNVITAIQFDGAGMMYLAQRGEFTGAYDYQLFAKPQASVVLRYQWDQAQRRWAEVPEEYAIGLPPEHRATTGGIALNYGYDRNGRINYGACRQTLWTTGEHLREGEDVKRVSTGGPRVVHGLQGNYKSQVRPANEPPYESWFVDYDGKYEDGEVNGHIGNVAIYAVCQGAERVEAMAIPVVVPGEPDLTLEKHCFVTPYGGRVRCLITVRNTGGAIPVEDIVLIEDTRILYGPNAGRPVVIAEFREDKPGWTCTATGAPEFSCRLTARDLGPGMFRTIEVWVDTGPILIGGNYGFNNCVILRHPNGSRRACHEGGTEIIVEKTGPAVCQPGGKCRYGLTIRNVGDEPYSGGLLLNDHMTSGGAPFSGQITSISQPLGCTPEPTQVPFTCAANVTLAAGEARTIWIEVQIPSGPGGYVIENCFWVTDRTVVSNDNLRDRLVRLVKDERKPNRHFLACVKTRVPWLEQPKVPYIPTIPGGGQGFIPLDPVCWNGQIALPGGRCACPGNTRWDPELGACRRPPEHGCYDPSRTMPNGACCPWGSRWDSESWSCRRPPPQGCFDAARRTPNGDCCPVGTRWDWRSKSCSQPGGACPNDSRPLPNGMCGCPIGTRWDPITRSCGKRGDQTGGKCPDGSPKIWGGGCRCPEGTAWNIASQSCARPKPPVCRVGTVWNPVTKHCDNIAQVPKCPLNQPVFNPVTKRCERAGGTNAGCPTGQTRVGDKCVSSKLPITCSANQHRIGDKCVDNVKPGDCKPGFVKTPSGACLPKSVTERCPAGQVRQDDGGCKPLLKTIEPKQIPKKIEPKQIPKKVEIKKVPVPKKHVTTPKRVEKATKNVTVRQTTPKKAVPKKVVEPKKKVN